ncbi:FTR1 family protein [Clostridium sp. JNZ J1-5]
MITSLIVSFRECFEMLLILVPLLAYISKIDRKDLAKYIYSGSLLGVLSSIICGVLIFNQVKSLEFAVQGLFEGSIMLFLAALILYSIVLIKKQRKQLNTDSLDASTVKTTSYSLFVLSFLTIFRESLEITLFTLPYVAKSAFSIVSGIAAGVILALVIMYVIYKTSLKLSINLIFNILTILLIGIGSVSFGEGLAKLLPSMGQSLEKGAMLIYGIPTLYLFIKSLLREYAKKQNK